MANSYGADAVLAIFNRPDLAHHLQQRRKGYAVRVAGRDYGRLHFEKGTMTLTATPSGQSVQAIGDSANIRQWLIGQMFHGDMKAFGAAELC